MSELTPKQAKFVAEYLIDLNATQAAIRAGYPAKTANRMGSENLAKPVIALALQDAMAERARRTEITQDRVLLEFSRIGFSDLRKAVSWRTGETTEIGDDGEERATIRSEVRLTDSADLDDDTAAAIAEISQTDKGGLKIKLHDKRAALESIGRHLGMFRDRMEHSVGGTLEELIMEALRARTERDQGPVPAIADGRDGGETRR